MDQISRDRLAHKIKLIRGKLKQSEFAEILDVASGSISGWENGKNIPTIENMEKLAELSNQVPEEFLAEVYGRTISTSEDIPIEEKIKSYSLNRLALLLVAIASVISPLDISEDLKKNEQIYNAPIEGEK